MVPQDSLSRRQARPLDHFKDCYALGLPAIGDSLEVVMRELHVNRGDEFTGACETVATDDTFIELAKKALDQIEPRGTLRREVNVNARAIFMPRADRGMVVRGVVVEDQMQG